MEPVFGTFLATEPDPGRFRRRKVPKGGVHWPSTDCLRTISATQKSSKSVRKLPTRTAFGAPTGPAARDGITNDGPLDRNGAPGGGIHPERGEPKPRVLVHPPLPPDGSRPLWCRPRHVLTSECNIEGLSRPGVPVIKPVLRAVGFDRVRVRAKGLSQRVMHASLARQILLKDGTCGSLQVRGKGLGAPGGTRLRRHVGRMQAGLQPSRCSPTE